MKVKHFLKQKNHQLHQGVKSTNLILQCWHAYEPFLHYYELWMVDTDAAPLVDDQLSELGTEECFLPYDKQQHRQPWQNSEQWVA